MRKVMVVVVVASLAATTLSAGAVGSSGFQDRYVIATETYRNVTAAKYVTIHDDVKRHDSSAARTMRDAAADYCRNTGGVFHPKTFECAR